MMDHRYLLSAREITKTYGKVPALDRVSIDIEAGEFFTLLGPSGSGKSTFLMCVGGFIEPTSGRLYAEGVDITRKPAEDRRFGMVFQGYALFPHMTVTQNVEFPLKVAGLNAAERRKRVADMLRIVGLSDLHARRPAELSGGQQQRVALARALVSKPKLLLLDEPLSALDKNLREQMQEELKTLQKVSGSTFVFVTHDQTEALSLSSRVAIFNKGRLQQIGTPQEAYERPRNRFVAEFLGRINLVPLEDAKSKNAMMVGRFEGRVLKGRTNGRTGPAAVLAVRPEHMAISLNPPPADRNGLRVRLVDRVYGGANSVLQLASMTGLSLSLDIRSSNELPSLQLGQELWVTWSEEQAFALPAVSTEEDCKEE
jgi:putative spermidine/putrescine transport system ATP-binding protein